MAPLAYFGFALLVLVIGFIVYRVVVRRDYSPFGRLRPLSAMLQYVAIGAWVVFGCLNLARGWPTVDVGTAQGIVGGALFTGAGWSC